MNTDNSCTDAITRTEISLTCAVCHSKKFQTNAVLWDELANAWELSPYERAYIDEQQGKVCTTCGSNIRSIALAAALLNFLERSCSLIELIEEPLPANFRFLEINTAGALHPYLSKLTGHQHFSFPEIDLQSLAFPTGHFDLLIHSDTLEHVPDPRQALKESLRVLKPGGATLFTVPIIVDRMTRSRRTLPPSYHGNTETVSNDFLVHNEFGCDIWTLPLEAGFSSCEIINYCYPAGIAMIARKPKLEEKK